jgi:hypothetical protein
VGTTGTWPGAPLQHREDPVEPYGTDISGLRPCIPFFEVGILKRTRGGPTATVHVNPEKC